VGRAQDGKIVAMADLVERITFGNVVEVKVVLASVALALAVYQLMLIAIGYGKLRPAWLGPRAATWTHRASGDAIAVVLVIVALMCVTYFGFEDDATLHVMSGSALLVVLGVKIAVIRWLPAAGRFLPVLGMAVFALLSLTWLTSAGHFLADD
jgi:hypothetical protein